MERNTKQQGAPRPDIPNLARMLADAAANYGTIRRNGAISEEDTANVLLERMGELAEELAITDIYGDRFCSLMLIVSDYTMTAQSIYSRDNAAKAAAGLRQIVQIWGLINNYRSELWQFSNAMAAYQEAKKKADDYQWEIEKNARVEEAAKSRRLSELAELTRTAAKYGAVITFPDEDTAATDDPDADSHKEDTESNEPETITNNISKL